LSPSNFARLCSFIDSLISMLPRKRCSKILMISMQVWRKCKLAMMHAEKHGWR
jgi:hypothetical protein